MKKKIKPEDFPIEINKENIDILARMKLNYPPPVKFPPPYGMENYYIFFI